MQETGRSEEREREVDGEREKRQGSWGHSMKVLQVRGETGRGEGGG